MEKGFEIKKTYSGKKVYVHEEFLKDIRSHNRKLVAEKNSLIDELTQANLTIKKQNDEILNLKEEIQSIKEIIKELQENKENKETESETNSKLETEEIEYNTSFTEEEPEQVEIEQPKSINNHEYYPRENITEKVIYRHKELTTMELEIIGHLRRSYNSYMDLRGKIGKGTNERAIAVHISSLRKNFNIPIQKKKRNKINFYYIEKNDLIQYMDQIQKFEMENPELYNLNLF